MDVIISAQSEQTQTYKQKHVKKLLSRIFFKKVDRTWTIFSNTPWSSSTLTIHDNMLDYGSNIIELEECRCHRGMDDPLF